MKVKPEILYLTYDGLTDPLGESQILPYLLGLSSVFEITIVSFEKPKAFRQKKTGINEIVKNKIKWVPKLYTKNPPIISTLYDLFILRIACKKIIERKSISLVHCRSYITSLVGLWLKRKYNIKFIFDMRGFWPEERIEGGLWRLDNPMYRWIYNYFKQQEIAFLKHADAVIVLTYAAEEILKARGRSHGVATIPCCVDTVHFDPARIRKTDQALIRSQLGLNENGFVLTYIGSMGTWYLLEEMFDYFNALRRENSDAKLLIISTHPEKEIVHKAKLRQVHLDSLIIRPATRSEMPILISISDFTVLFIKASFSKKGSSPTKLGESLAMGVPAVANAGVGDADYLFADNSIGILLSQLTSSHFKNAVNRMLNHNKDEVLIREFAIKNLSLDKGVALYNEVYNKILLV